MNQEAVDKPVDTFDQIIGVVLDVLAVVGVFATFVAGCFFYAYFTQ